MGDFISKAANQTFFIVAASLFLGSSLLHLLFCFLEKETARRITKILPTLSLGLSMLAYSSMLYLPAIGFFFYALGDLIMLLKNKKIALGAGGFSFFFGDCAGIIYLFTCLGLGWRMSLVIAILFYTLFFILGSGVAKKLTKIMFFRIAGVVYFATLVFLFLMFIVCGIARSPIFLFGALGMLSFIGSDALIVYHAAVKKIKRRHFKVMASYLLAQVLLAVAYLFTFVG